MTIGPVRSGSPKPSSSINRAQTGENPPAGSGKAPSQSWPTSPDQGEPGIAKTATSLSEDFAAMKKAIQDGKKAISTSGPALQMSAWRREIRDGIAESKFGKATAHAATVTGQGVVHGPKLLKDAAKMRIAVPSGMPKPAVKEKTAEKAKEEAVGPHFYNYLHSDLATAEDLAKYPNAQPTYPVKYTFSATMGWNNRLSPTLGNPDFKTGPSLLKAEFKEAKAEIPKTNAKGEIVKDDKGNTVMETVLRNYEGIPDISGIYADAKAKKDPSSFQQVTKLGQSGIPFDPKTQHPDNPKMDNPQYLHPVLPELPKGYEIRKAFDDFSLPPSMSNSQVLERPKADGKRPALPPPRDPYDLDTWESMDRGKSKPESSNAAAAGPSGAPASPTLPKDPSRQKNIHEVDGMSFSSDSSVKKHIYEVDGMSFSSLSVTSSELNERREPPSP